jgi:hypothetical protein
MNLRQIRILRQSTISIKWLFLQNSNIVPFLGRLGMRGSGSSSSRMPVHMLVNQQLKVPLGYVRLRSNLLDSPYSCSSGVS